jgi:hypothetical protein
MKNYIVLIIVLMSTRNLHAQTSIPVTNREELKLLLNESGSRFLKWTFSNQVWLRYNDSNPGSTVLGESANKTFDIGLRRTRIQFFGQLTDHVFFYTQFGQNNFNYLSQNAGNRKLQVFFHDALGEYKIWKEKDWLKLGAGLTITNGLSRFSQPSVSSIMTMDVPVFAQATVDQTDEFSRKLSVYARGQAGKLDYRLVLSDPFPVNTSGAALPPPDEHAAFAQTGHHKQYQGFFAYNIFDSEPNMTPYMAGTYLGKKKVLNIEAGFISQRNATWSKPNADADSIFHNMNLWSAALYFDAPVNIEKGTAISAYAGFFNLNYGPGYLRYNGTMNPANGISPSPAPGSQGNAFPMFGSGKVVYAQLGFLLGKNLLGESNGRLMPYASVMQANYERLADSMNVLATGVNWLINGHNSKLTVDYQSRPVYEKNGDTLETSGRRGQVVLQYQIFI